MKDQNNYKGLSVMESIKAYEAKKNEFELCWRNPLDQMMKEAIEYRVTEITDGGTKDKGVMIVDLPFGIARSDEDNAELNRYYGQLLIDNVGFIYLVRPDDHGHNVLRRIYLFEDIMQLYCELHAIGFFDKTKQQRT